MIIFLKKFGVNHTLWSYNFLNYKFLVPINLKHLILIQNFIFFYHRYEREEKIIRF
jgi:aminopeptidase C